MRYVDNYPIPGRHAVYNMDDDRDVAALQRASQVPPTMREVKQRNWTANPVGTYGPTVESVLGNELTSLDNMVKPADLLDAIDEAHELPEETLAQVRALAESDLDGECRLQVVLVGLPRLRAELQSYPHMWRRIVVREDLTGLQADELPEFLEHHFGPAQAKRLCEQGLAMLFEYGKGSPGLILPLCRRIFAAAPGKAKIEPECVEDVLHRWDFA